MIELFLLLVFGHFMADYAFQSEFMALGKNRHNPLPGAPWFHLLGAHSAIHAGVVGIITGYWVLGVFEFILHWIIDDNRCAKNLTYTQDQALHIGCKVLWVVLTAAMGLPVWL